MNRIIQIIVAVLVAVALARTPNRLPTRSDSHDKQRQAEIERHFEKYANVEAISLSADHEGRYSGFGSTADGRPIQLDAKRSGMRVVWRANSILNGRTLEVAGGEFSLDAP